MYSASAMGLSVELDYEPPSFTVLRGRTPSNPLSNIERIARLPLTSLLEKNKKEIPVGRLRLQNNFIRTIPTDLPSTR